MSEIHSTAVVETGAELEQDVVIGPYCLVGARVRLGNNVKLLSHVVVTGRTTIGESCTVFPFAALGNPPQHLKHMGEDTQLIIGANNIIRESVTMNPGTSAGGGVTRVGDHGFFMAYSHVAHDSKVGSNVIFTNGATIGGHVTIGDYVIIGGLAAVHQNCRVGRHAIVGGMTGVEADVIPYGSVIGNRAYLAGLNLLGLKRRGFGRDTIHDLRNAYRLLYAQEGTFQERLEEVADLYKSSKEVMDIVTFIRADSTRGLVMPRLDRGG
jgi:UDP-N-acetylglucosamine acyltransferase